MPYFLSALMTLSAAAFNFLLATMFCLLSVTTALFAAAFNFLLATISNIKICLLYWAIL